MQALSKHKLNFLFSFSFFLIQIVSSTFLSVLTLIAISLGWIHNPAPLFMLVIFIIMSIFSGTLLTKLVGKHVLKPIIQLNEAAHLVSQGNFNIQLEEKAFGKEIRELIRSFNIMTKELSHIETFRNDFVANVSHKFKTPLAVIEGYVTLLQDETLSKQERQNYIDLIISSSKRLSALINNILLISKLENQDIVLDKTTYSLDEQIRNSILSMEKFWSEKNLNWDIEMESISYLGNKNMVSQIWYNLISNAIKFSSENGTISVRLSQDDACITASIQDYGTGMSPETLDHIFEKFYSMDPSGTHNGNGLGLTLVHRIICLCNGEIHVESAEGKGTTFTVKLYNDNQKTEVSDDV